ncbi:MAG: hypothetical protein ACPGID_07230 [Rubricella sp.]
MAGLDFGAVNESGEEVFVVDTPLAKGDPIAPGDRVMTFMLKDGTRVDALSDRAGRVDRIAAVNTVIGVGEVLFTARGETGADGPEEVVRSPGSFIYPLVVEQVLVQDGQTIREGAATISLLQAGVSQQLWAGASGRVDTVFVRPGDVLQAPKPLYTLFRAVPQGGPSVRYVAHPPAGKAPAATDPKPAAPRPATPARPTRTAPPPPATAGRERTARLDRWIGLFVLLAALGGGLYAARFTIADVLHERGIATPWSITAEERQGSTTSRETQPGTTPQGSTQAARETTEEAIAPPPPPPVERLDMARYTAWQEAPRTENTGVSGSFAALGAGWFSAADLAPDGTVLLYGVAGGRQVLAALAPTLRYSRTDAPLPTIEQIRNARQNSGIDDFTIRYVEGRPPWTPQEDLALADPVPAFVAAGRNSAIRTYSSIGAGYASLTAAYDAADTDLDISVRGYSALRGGVAATHLGRDWSAVLLAPHDPDDAIDALITGQRQERRDRYLALLHDRNGRVEERYLPYRPREDDLAYIEDFAILYGSPDGSAFDFAVLGWRSNTGPFIEAGTLYRGGEGGLRVSATLDRAALVPANVLNAAIEGVRDVAVLPASILPHPDGFLVLSAVRATPDNPFDAPTFLGVGARVMGITMEGGLAPRGEARFFARPGRAELRFGDAVPLSDESGYAIWLDAPDANFVLTLDMTLEPGSFYYPGADIGGIAPARGAEYMIVGRVERDGAMIPYLSTRR